MFGESSEEIPSVEQTRTREEQKTSRDFTQSKDMIEHAVKLYEEAINAQRQGDWATYGQKINELGAVLNKLLDEQP